jgi:hypothetical protein
MEKGHSAQTNETQAQLFEAVFMAMSTFFEMMDRGVTV